MTDVRTRIFATARQLAEELPIDRITLTAIAERANVSCPTVRRHVGDKAGLRRFLLQMVGSGAAVMPDTRTRILISALKVFARNGYDRSSLDEVAADAGLTKGAIYWHFRSKGDLFLALLEEHIRRELERAELDVRAFAAADEPAVGLATILVQQISRFQSDPDWSRLLVEFFARAGDAEVRQRLRRMLIGARESVCQLISELQAGGRVASDIDPPVLAELYIAIVHGLMLTWLGASDEVEPNDWAPGIARILVHGIRADKETLC